MFSTGSFLTGHAKALYEISADLTLHMQDTYFRKLYRQHCSKMFFPTEQLPPPPQQCGELFIK